MYVFVIVVMWKRHVLMFAISHWIALLLKLEFFIMFISFYISFVVAKLTSDNQRGEAGSET